MLFRRRKCHSKYRRTTGMAAGRADFPVGGVVKAFIFAVLLSIFPEVGNCNDLMLIPSITLQEEYNDNLFFEEDDRTDDFITTISPRLSLTKKNERINSELSIRLDDVIYLDKDEFNAVDQFYKGYLNYRFTPRLSVSGNAGFSKDSRSDRDIESTGLTLGTTIRDRQEYGFSGFYILTEKTSLTLSSAYDEEEFDDPEYNDNSSHGVNVGMTHDIGGLLPRTIAQMNLGYNHYHFTNSEVDNFSLTFGAGREINEKISLLVDLGARYTESEFDVTRWVIQYPYFTTIREEKTISHWGGVGRISLSYKGEFNKFDLTFTRDVRAASGREDAAERTAINASVKRRFTKKISGVLAGGYFLNQTDDNDLSDSAFDEETFYFRSSLHCKFNENVSLNAFYNYTRIIDNENDTDSRRNVFFVNVTYRYPFFE